MYNYNSAKHLSDFYYISINYYDTFNDFLLIESENVFKRLIRRLN